jgi:1-deoxy-D-xylulose-5-phosphate synthase
MSDATNIDSQPFKAGPFLEKVGTPEDLRREFQSEDLPQLCDELRQFIIDVVSEKGGHFGASLGVVELTVALHYVFDTPNDSIVWDVGHQAYGHKILTGRRDQFHTNRKFGGISGFPNRAESPYDAFGVGHSSTSISAALGMAVADRIQGRKSQSVAVIGDGAMTAGLAFEGMNHGGIEDTNLLIVLNDNCMSIDPNVGALKEYLTDITTSPTYNKVKDEVWQLLGKISKFGPNAQAIAAKVADAVKGSLLGQSNLFEALNFRYFGPVDGHDVVFLEQVMRDLKDIPGPKILHCVTRKGKGFAPAESGSPTKWHAPGLFNKDTGELIKVGNRGAQPPKFQDVFGETMVELAEQDDRIVGVTPAMPSGCSMKIMMDAMPGRAFDVGIAEQHAVTFAAGMATRGLVPFCNVYSSFMQRAFDQVVHDVAIQNLHMVMCLDRGGLVGADGATHHGAYDIAFMRCIPNMTICSPMNEEELRNLMYTGASGQTGPFAIRYPRGTGVMADWRKPLRKIEVGTGRRVSDGDELAILTLGPVGNLAADAVRALAEDGYAVAHYDIRFVKPLDEVMLHEIFGRFDHVITVEDGCIRGGFGSAVLEFMAAQGYRASVQMLGIPDRFIEHGTQAELYAECGFSTPDIVSAAVKICDSRGARGASNAS